MGYNIDGDFPLRERVDEMRTRLSFGNGNV